MKKHVKLLSLLVSVLMIFSVMSTTGFAETETHSHPVCGNACVCASGSHRNNNWKVWDGKTTLYDGYYYLEEDIVLSSTKILNYSYTTHLCLNGHSITCNDTVFDIYSNRSLVITDCVGTGLIETAGGNSYSSTINNARSLTIWNGTIKNSNKNGLAIYTGYYNIPPILSVCGGTIDGVYAGIQAGENAIVEIYEGTVQGQTYGIELSPASVLNIYGGTVKSVLSSAISGWGDNNISKATLIRVSGGTITSAAKSAINLPNMRFEISGGYIYGDISCFCDYFYENTISGGTIDGRISACLKDQTTITGGEFLKEVNLHNTVSISGGTFKAPVIIGYDPSSIVNVCSITGGTFEKIIMNDGHLYISNNPSIKNLKIRKPNLVSASNINGTSYYNGDNINILLNYNYSWTDGDIAVNNVTSDAVAEKFTSSTDYEFIPLERIGNNLVLKHIYSISGTPATHLEKGKKTYTCECGDSYTETIEKLPDHTYETVVTAPTCTEKGYTTYTCKCGDSYVADYVKENGHSHISEITTPATHLTEGVMTYACICGDSYTEILEKLEEHSYNASIIAPSCTSSGYTHYICECGDNYISDYTDIIDHEDYDSDEYCDYCADFLGTEIYCSHMCHKSGIMGFFWEIINFFQMLFGINPVCECGAAHY